MELGARVNMGPASAPGSATQDCGMGCPLYLVLGSLLISHGNQTLHVQTGLARNATSTGSSERIQCAYRTALDLQLAMMCSQLCANGLHAI
jgi:hypothetical protein